MLFRRVLLLMSMIVFLWVDCLSVFSRLMVRLFEVDVWFSVI